LFPLGTLLIYYSDNVTWLGSFSQDSSTPSCHWHNELQTSPPFSLALCPQNKSPAIRPCSPYQMAVYREVLLPFPVCVEISPASRFFGIRISFRKFPGLLVSPAATAPFLPMSLNMVVFPHQQPKKTTNQKFTKKSPTNHTTITLTPKKKQRTPKTTKKNPHPSPTTYPKQQQQKQQKN